ncbi:unnamed protein product [Rhizophagus irregularis]|nr:unnamed protein product [Rhizophagus irregularis]
MSSNNMSSLQPNNSPRPDSPRPNSLSLNNMSSLQPNISPQPDPPRPDSSRPDSSQPNSPRDNLFYLPSYPLYHNSSTSPHTPLYHNSSTSPHTPLYHNSSTSPSSSTSPQSPTSPHTTLYHNSSTSPRTSTLTIIIILVLNGRTGLIEQQRERNYEYYYSIVGRSRRNFWNTIAESVNRSCGCNYTGKQCQTKFNSLVSNYHDQLLVIADNLRGVRSRPRAVFFEVMNTRFWERPAQRNNNSSQNTADSEELGNGNDD